MNDDWFMCYMFISLIEIFYILGFATFQLFGLTGLIAWICACALLFILSPT